MIRPAAIKANHFALINIELIKQLFWVGNKGELTLDNSQEDNDDEEEKGDVEKDAVELVGVSGRVLDLVPYASPCPHPDIHVEEVTLRTEGGGQR